MNKFSFRKGFDQVQNGNLQQVKNEIMDALDIHNRTSWSKRLNGEIEPKASQVKSIENIFNRYGINEVWGE